MPAHAGFIVDIRGQKRSLPYLCYREVCGKTFQYGTKGWEHPVWSREVHLALTEWPEGIWPPDDDIGYFIQNPTFNFVINQAINVIDDPRLVAEVAHFRYLSTQMPAVLERSNILKQLLQDMEKHRDEVKALNDAFSNEYQQCVAWLQAGHARSQVERAIQSLADGKKAGGRFYWPRTQGHPLHPCLYTFPQYHHEWYLTDSVPEPPPMAQEPTRDPVKEAAHLA